jgi:hypothetical protein
VKSIIDYSENILDNSSDKETNLWTNIFWIGFTIYTLSWTITTTAYINYIPFQVIQLFGILLFVPAALKLIKWKLENVYLKFIFILYCTWIFTVIIRGFIFEYKFIKVLIFDSYEGIFVYLSPLILLFPKNLIYLNKVFKVIVILGVFYIIYDIYCFNDLLFPGQNTKSQGIVEYFSKTLSIPSGFLLLTYIYQSKKRRLFALFLIILTFIFVLIRARRGMMFMVMSILTASYIIYFFTNKVRIINGILSIILVSFIFAYGANIYNKNKTGLFSFFEKRKMEDTRSPVELYFYKDMTTKDWIIGKGINGSYYCPGIDNAFSTYRYGIETDYLSIILKGGIISLGLQLLIIIPAIFKGLFRSKNVLSKAAGIWILLYVKDLYPVPVTDFTLNYLLVWISIAICYSKDIREIPETKLVEIFSERFNNR